MDIRSAASFSLGSLTGSIRNGEPGRLCEVDEDSASADTEHEEVDAMLVSCGDGDGFVSGIEVEYSQGVGVTSEKSVFSI